MNAGGTDATPATFAWTIAALVLPDTTITSTPPASTATTSASFSFTSTPVGATFECSLDGAAFGVCSSPQAYGSVPPGNHTFSVRAVNGAGIDPTPATYNWTVTGPACPCSLWAATTVPATTSTDTGASRAGHEVPVRSVRSDQRGPVL